MNGIPPPVAKYRVWFKDLNILKLKEALSKEIENMTVDWLEGKSVEECVSQLTEMVQKICDENTIERRVPTKAEPWWVLQLLIERKQVSAARSQYRWCEDEEEREKYEILFRKIRAKFKRSVRRAK